MSKLKIKFLKDYTQYDSDYPDGVRHFVADQVVSLGEASAMHYVKREVAELVGSRAKVGKPKIDKQEDLLDVDLTSKDIPELVKIANEKYPEVDLPDVFEKDQLVAFIGNGDASVFDVASDESEGEKSIGSTISDWFKRSKPGSDVDLENLENSDLLEIARESYPDADIPDEPEKDQLLDFIDSGDVSVFVASDKQ